jgi:phenylalanyl-tRNA synthetase alpha chain
MFCRLKTNAFIFYQRDVWKVKKIRLRPSFFRFTEPSAEVDIYWGLKQKPIIELPKELVG